MKDWFADTAQEAEYAKTHPSSRQAKRNVLFDEIEHWTLYEAVDVFANELSWRMVMRIVNKLRRKRGLKE